MSDTLYLVELVSMTGEHIGLEKFTIKELATLYIDNFDDISIYCNLFEARQLDY